MLYVEKKWLLLALIPLITSFKALANEGDIINLEKPITVSGLIVDHGLKPMSFWFEPFPEDEESIVKVKTFFKSQKSAYIRDYPLLFQFRLIGFRSGVSNGTDLSGNDFNKEVSDSIEKIVLGQYATLHCYGYYSRWPVPFCTAVNMEGDLIAGRLIESGMGYKDSAFGSGPDEHERHLELAEEKAKARQVGVWKPFHHFFRGLE